MFLNTLQPSDDRRKKARRVGRGIGSTLGKTCGRGHKGQKSRSGGFHKVGFEGGQMPLQRRLPKFGFTSRQKKYVAQVRLSELAGLDAEVIDIDLLKANSIVQASARRVKVFQSGSLDKAVVLKGILVTPGARSVIEANGGKIEG